MKPIRSSLPSSSWLVATVVPWLTAVTAPPPRPRRPTPLPTPPRQPPARPARAARGARGGGEVQQAGHLADAGEEALGGVGRGGRRLGGGRGPRVLVDGDDVGERAPGVDADPHPASRCHAPIP